MVAAHLRTELVLNALDMAVQQHRLDSVIYHSDQGCQHLLRLRRALPAMGVVPSMGSVGDCFDNAMAESFFTTLEKPNPLTVHCNGAIPVKSLVSQ